MVGNQTTPKIPVVDMNTADAMGMTKVEGCEAYKGERRCLGRIGHKWTVKHTMMYLGLGPS